VSDIERLLADLIALPSVNPAFLPVSHPHAGEHRVSEYLGAKARRARLDVELCEVAPNRVNVIARLRPPNKVTTRILLAPHLDTVNGATDQFSPRKRNGRIFGRGACDTKGSVASMFLAICDLARFGKRPSVTEIVFAGLVDEENAQAGSRSLGAAGMKADLAIVGEPTRLQVVTAHKGSVWLELKTRGKSAHGARPELGKNAVHAMARVVDLLETKYAEQLRSRTHPLLGCATVNVGTIQGGTQPNIVPDGCEIKIDRRTLPGENESTVRREIQSILRLHNLRANLGTAKLEPCLPLETNPKLPLVSEFMRCTGQTKCLGVDYFCDASVLSQSGIPSVIFGPGDIAQAHTSEEWVSIKSLERARKLLASYLRALP